MTSFFYVVSIAFIQEFQRFGSPWIPLKKKSFRWERSHTCTRSRRVCYRTNAVHELLVHSTLAVVTDTHHHTEVSFADEFRWVSPLHYLKNEWQTLFFFGECCKWGCHLYTTTALSCCIPASYCHLSATLQTMSIIVVNLQDNRVEFRILSRF